MARAAEIFVGRRRAVTADNIDLRPGLADRRSQITQEVESLRVQRDLIAGSMISQEMIELLDGVGNLGVSPAVDDIDPLVRVQIKETQPVLLCGGTRV